MFQNNEKNDHPYEYHYSYHPDYTEPGCVIEEKQTEQKKTGRRGVKIMAAALSAVLLLGGAFGVGRLSRSWGGSKLTETQLLLSQRPKAEVDTVSVTAGEAMTFPEIYAANVNSCVSINVSSTGYNYFGQAVKTASSGSGFVITADGYIVTNYHVINGGQEVEVTLNDGSSYPAQVIGGDEDYDIAVIKVDPGETALQSVVLGSSDSLLVGDQVLAIGNPLGQLTFSMSEGIVSCLNREINVDGTPFNMIQITAAVNSGNSGGPLFNIYGEVVGIVSAKYSSSSSGASVEGLGFSIPIDDVLGMIKDIMENGQVTTRPYMGVRGTDAAAYPKTGVNAGGYLLEVVAGGPAEKAGLQAGDVITMVDSTVITSWSDVSSAVGGKSYVAGDTVTITYVRSGQVATTELTFGSTVDMVQTDTQQERQEQSTQAAPSGPDSYYYDDNMQDFFERFFGAYSGKNA